MSSCSGGKCGHDHSAEVPKEDEKLRDNLKKIQNKLVVMSGKGGVGKSSIATYLALGLAKAGYRVGLLDVDLHGPSIPGMLGISGMYDVDQSKCLVPHTSTDKLQVISMQCLLEDRDAAVIWRGPVKHGVIKQFISEVNWGELDFLVIDSPPGTGDEPLSVAQTIPDAHAIIVTTPQEVALADVRKSINFCRKVNMPMLGLVENMSGLICPHCNQEIPLFRKGGGVQTASRMGVHFLGSLPFDPKVVEAGDMGQSAIQSPDQSQFFTALDNLVKEVISRCAMGSVKPEKTVEKGVSMASNHNLRVAVPLAAGVLTNHFGHCEQFAIVNVQDGKIADKELHTPPPHEPGVLPRWLGELKVNLIIAGGMGARALDLFNQQNIQVITGAPNLQPEELVHHYMAGTLTTGANVCDH